MRMRGIILKSAICLAGLALLGLIFWPEPAFDADSALPTETELRRQQAVRRGAWLDEVVFVRESDRGKVVNLIERGRLQVYAAGISNPVLVQRLDNSARADYDLSSGSSVELTMNTAGPHFEDGRLNPFHNRRIREACNWLIDRDYISDELFGGLANPRFLPFSTVLPDYARLARTARMLELRYAHDPERARRVIVEELEAMGARRQDGQWFYNNERMEIILLIRTEDARVQVGDYVANLLEDLGFQVQRLYRTAEESSRLWIAGDPAAGRWHLYTGGWQAVVISRDQAGDFDQFYTARGRPEPLWQTYDPDPELDEIAERLGRRDYRTWDERQELMARGLELALRESTRVWLLDQSTAWPRARNVELAVDLAGGFGGSGLWPYTLRFTDRVGGRMVVGMPGFLAEPWNQVAGSNWIFDRMIMRALSDPVVLPDPFTGLFHPQRIERAEVAVEEGVPVNRTLDWLSLDRVASIEVPADAWLDWDSEAGRFRTVGERHPEGSTARTRTRVIYQDDYLQRFWHDGSRLSPADIVLSWILFFERAHPDSPLFDRASVPIFNSFQTHFRGWRIVGREPLTIEIYSDQVYHDAEWIVGARAPGASPWHTLALGILAERGGELAWSSDKADRERVEWLNQVGGPSLAVLDRMLARAQAEQWLPYEQFLDDFVEPGEVAERYRALAAWRRDKGHFWVGNGPYYLESASPVAGSLVLRRFERFDDPADKWVRFARPPVPVVELTGPTLVEPGTAFEFKVAVTHDGQPYPRAAVESIGFMLLDGDDRLWLEGEPEPAAAPGEWRISIDGATSSGLAAGACTLEVVVNSQLVALPTFASRAFAAVDRREGGDDAGQ